jgi:L-malate glycosyltransferase
MKILIASHTYIVDLNCDKLRILTQLEPDIEVTVIAPKFWNPTSVQTNIIETQSKDEGRFKLKAVSTLLTKSHQGLMTFAADLIPILQGFKPDIIHVEQGARALTYAQFITLNKLLGLGAKNTFFTWWNLHYNLKFPASVLEKYNLDNTAGAISGNVAGVDILRQRGYEGKATILPQLGVDEKLFVPEQQPDLKAKLGIKDDEFVIGFVGRFVEEKGIITLLSALSQLTAYKWKLLLLGKGELEPILREKADSDRLSDRIIWVDGVTHEVVPKYINLMNVLVLPSETNYKFKTLTAVGWKEQFGHVLIEAMACKVPVIGSDCGEIPNVIADTGLVFPEGNINELKVCLEKLIFQPELCQKLGDLGYERAMKKYTNYALAKEWLKFFQEVFNS